MSEDVIGPGYLSRKLVPTAPRPGERLMGALPDSAYCTSYGPCSAKLLLDADVAAASRHIERRRCVSTKHN